MKNKEEKIVNINDSSLFEIVRLDKAIRKCEKHVKKYENKYFKWFLCSVIPSISFFLLYLKTGNPVIFSVSLAAFCTPAVVKSLKDVFKGHKNVDDSFFEDTDFDMHLEDYMTNEARRTKEMYSGMNDENKKYYAALEEQRNKRYSESQDRKAIEERVLYEFETYLEMYDLSHYIFSSSDFEIICDSLYVLLEEIGETESYYADLRTLFKVLVFRLINIESEKLAIDEFIDSLELYKHNKLISVDADDLINLIKTKRRERKIVDITPYIMKPIDKR